MKNNSVDLYHEQKSCSNLHVTGICKMHGSDRIYAMVWFEKPNLGVDREVAIPISDAASLRFENLIPEGFIIGNKTLKQTQKHIYECISSVLHTAMLGVLLPQGYTHTDGGWVYVWGDEVINAGPSHSMYYPYNPRNLKINIQKDDEGSGDQSWFQWCKTYCKAGDAQAALFLCALTPFLHPITEALKLPSKVANAFVVGRSSTGKTSYSKLLTDIGDGNPVGLNLATDKKVLVEELSENYTDRSFLLDDLNFSSSEREMEKKKFRLSEVIQMSASAGGIRLDDKTVDLSRTSLIITGEYLPNAASTINRCIVIGFNEEFDSARLTELQNSKQEYGNFIVRFVSWVCTNAERLTDCIQDQLQNGELDYHSEIIPSEYIGYSRIISSYRLLKIAQTLVMQFFVEQQVFMSQDQFVRLYRRLGGGIETAISDTFAEVRIDDQQMSDIVAVIAGVFAQNTDKVVAKRQEQFFEGSKIFFRHDDIYCCRGEALATYISSKLGREVSTTAISQALAGVGILVPYGGEYSSKLPKMSGKFGKSDNRRYYRLSVPALMDVVTSLYPDVLERIKSPIKELRPKEYR